MTTMNEEHDGEIKVTDRRGQPRQVEETPHIAHQPKAAEKKAASSQTAKKPEEEAKPKEAFKGSIDFSTFILSLSSSAAVYLGIIEDPSTGLIQKNLNHARQQIDVIELLHHKTQGNLTPDEKKLIEQILYELKLRFVEASKPPPNP